MELIQISLKYFSFYEKFIFSVNRNPTFYGLTTKYITKLLVHWTIFQQITARIQIKSNNIDKPPLTSWSVCSEFSARLSRVTSRARVCLHLFPPCVLLPTSYSLNGSEPHCLDPFCALIGWHTFDRWTRMKVRHVLRQSALFKPNHCNWSYYLQLYFKIIIFIYNFCNGKVCWVMNSRFVRNIDHCK